MNEVLLISGLGINQIQDEDLYDAHLYYNGTEICSNDNFQFNNICYNPHNLVYKNVYSILRPKKEDIPCIISSSLSSILSTNEISFSFLDTSKIWKNENYSAEFKIVCISTTFILSLDMFDFLMNWVVRNIDFSSIVLGGVFAKDNCIYLLKKYNKIKYIITEDAELSLPLLLKAIDNKQSISTIPNLYYKENNEIYFTYELYEDINNYQPIKYHRYPKTISYLSSKGCAHTCKFCSIHPSTRYRTLSAEKIISDFDFYAKNGVERIINYDSTFFTPRVRIIKILDYLKHQNIKWDSYARTNEINNEDLIYALEESQCYRLNFGFESMCEKTLNNMAKKTSPENNRMVNSLLRHSKINTDVSFVIGYPGETPNDFEETKEYLLNEHFGHFNLYLFQLNNTFAPIWKEREKYNLIIKEDKKNENMWLHGGLNWSHIGMDSKTAKNIRSKTIKEVRMGNSKAIHRTWQNYYEFPFVKDLSKNENLVIEKLLDKLFFLHDDYHYTQRLTVLNEILKEFRKYEIDFKRNS